MVLQTGNMSSIRNSLSMGGRLVVGNAYASKRLLKKKKKQKKQLLYFYTMKKLSDVSLAFESMELQVSTAYNNFLPKWLTALQGWMVYLSGENLVDEGKYLWQQTWSLWSNREQLKAVVEHALAWCMFSQLQSEIVAWESPVDVLNCKPVPETRSCLFSSFLTLRISRVKVC